MGAPGRAEDGDPCGERKPEQGKYYRQERPMGAFQRVITLNVPIDRDAVVASLADGVLRITLPKAEEMKPRKIAINPEQPA